MADSEYTWRTVVVRLEVDEEAERHLSETVDEWRRGCQLATDESWEVCHTRSDVQRLAYDKVRDQTDLGSQHAVLATHQAAEAIKQQVEGDGDPDKPVFKRPSVVYDTRTMTLFDDETVSLTTTGDRVRCPLVVPDDGYTSQYIGNNDWEAAKSALQYRDGEFCLELGFRRPKIEIEPPDEDATVLGVSLGVDTLAVTSTAYFFSAGELNHRHREFADVRTALKDAGTRSAGRALRRASLREERHVRQRLHEIANGIVDEAIQYGCDVIAVGDIEDVHDQIPDADSFQKWLFETLIEFVEYKAVEYSVVVVEVNPEYTSQRCAECGFTHPQNRDLDRNYFTCLKCGYQQHDAYNAAKNVAFRCIRRGPLSASGVGATYCALQSGRVTPDGELVAHADALDVSESDVQG